MTGYQEGETTIRLSIALVTRNRTVWLRKCLESWRQQQPQPYEIVVSDDSDPSREGETRSIAEEFGCRWIRGPKRGLYANRNCAALACRGSHIMSADDDHTHPVGFLDAVLAAIRVAPERVWIFSECSPARPDAELQCPAELWSDGTYRAPRDTSDCAAIACGSSAYPRAVFDSGLRHDETYAFGAVWYLWGHTLRRAGFRISYSSTTFVWHDTDSSNDRRADQSWARGQIECGLYVASACAFRVQPSPVAALRVAKVALASLWPGGEIYGHAGRTRLSLREVLRALRRGASWRASAPADR